MSLMPLGHKKAPPGSDMQGATPPSPPAGSEGRVGASLPPAQHHTLPGAPAAKLNWPKATSSQQEVKRPRLLKSAWRRCRGKDAGCRVNEQSAGCRV